MWNNESLARPIEQRVLGSSKENQLIFLQLWQRSTAVIQRHQNRQYVQMFFKQPQQRQTHRCEARCVSCMGSKPFSLWQLTPQHQEQPTEHQQPLHRTVAVVVSEQGKGQRPHPAAQENIPEPASASLHLCSLGTGKFTSRGTACSSTDLHLTVDTSVNNMMAPNCFHTISINC